MEHQEPGLVIIGAGHAGSELALSARQQGWSRPIVLVGDEPDAPYQRPPLSKAYLGGSLPLGDIALRPPGVYRDAEIDMRLGVRVAAIDRRRRMLALQDGQSLRYAKLALCTGGRARPLACEGIDPASPPANLLSLRSRRDADALRDLLHARARVLIVGAGYVGLEVAASARALGAEVTVLEQAPRVLARVAGETLSAFVAAAHRAAGVRLLTGVSVRRMVCEQGRIVAVVLDDGRRLDADVVVAGVGMLPNVELAMAAGLAQEQGIVVDECCATADPHVVAAGDCTLQELPGYGCRQRIESVPNALEQARTAAAWLCGVRRKTQVVPWFWSDQYEHKLQLAGLCAGHDRAVVRGQPGTGSFSVLYLRGEHLIAADMVNRPADFLNVRRALETGRTRVLDIEAVACEANPLKTLLVDAEPVFP